MLPIDRSCTSLAAVLEEHRRDYVHTALTHMYTHTIMAAVLEEHRRDYVHTELTHTYTHTIKQTAIASSKHVRCNTK